MTDNTPLVIAAHGTRDPHGAEVARALVARVAAKLAPTPVAAGFVELMEPDIESALTDTLQACPEGERHAVVAPLMLGTGGHVQTDIPDSAHAAAQAVPGSSVEVAAYLGKDIRLLSALCDRLTTAMGDWEPRDVHVILLGRGAVVPEANSDHARLARMVWERSGTSMVHPAFIQVTRPSLPEALSQAEKLGATQIVVVPNFLFPGKLSQWTQEQVAAWSLSHAETNVRIADVIGDCDELAEVIIDRYRAAAQIPDTTDGSPTYLSGLRLTSRDVVVVGAGHVADRRVPRLVDAGANVRVISPTISIKLGRMVKAGEITWEQRVFSDADITDAWYVLALTNDPAINAHIAELCEQQRTFCVRGDDSRHGSAWTPAVEHAGGLTVGVIGNRDPQRSVAVRDAVLRALWT
ncbi:MAG: CbiX/SirB N-terminal domain-containing protein [Propionibacteriaceae bacterium]